MHNEVRTLFAILLIFAIVLTTACGSGGTPASTPAPASGQESGSTDAAPETPDSGTVETTPEDSASAELIEVTFVKNVDATITDNTLKKLVGETLEDNRWTRLIEEQLGYKVVYLWTANDQESYNLKLSTALASGDLPNIINLSGVQLKQAVSAGLATDIKPLYDGYASDLLKRIVDDGGPDAINAATFNGVWSGIGVGDCPIESSTLLYIREDWRMQTGLDVPTDLDEMYNMIEAFMEIAGDGAVGFNLTKDLFGGNQQTLDGLLNAYGAYHDFWLPKDGGLVYSNIQPEYKTAVAKAAEMYGKGMFDIEFPVKDGGKAAESLVSGQCGMYYGAHWTPLWPLVDAVRDDPVADWYAHPIPMADGSPAHVGIKSQITQWWMANSSFEHPEALIRIMNLYAEKNYDPELQEYVYYANPEDPNGGIIEAVWKLCPIDLYESFKNPLTAHVIQPHLNSGDPGDLFGERLTMWDYTLQGRTDKSMWGWNRIFDSGDEYKFPYGGASLIMYDAYMDGRYTSNAFVGAPTETMETNKTIIDNAWKEEMTKIITGQAPIDHFETAVQAWLSSGGEAITREVNEWYTSR